MLTKIFLFALFLRASLSQNQCQIDRLEAVKSGETVVKGSDLGSWFVLESWISSKPWTENDCDVESQGGVYLLEKCLGDKAQEVFDKHWSTFITEDDFAQLSTYGVNAVRLPIGWWHIYDTQGGIANANLNYHVTDADYKAVGGLSYIDKAFDWGEKYGIGIILDLHSAPGSQNGEHHSSPAVIGEANWVKSPDNVGQTVDSWALYAERYANRTALIAFELLNEPMDMNDDDVLVLQDYYLRAYDVIRQYSPDAFIIINALQRPWETGTEERWATFMNPDQGYTKVGMDLHYYSCMGGDSDFDNADDSINYINTVRAQQINDFKNASPKYQFIGEWAACGNFEEERKGEFTRAQIDVYSETTLGWTFWTWITDVDPEEWSLKYAFENEYLEPIYPC